MSARDTKEKGNAGPAGKDLSVLPDVLAKTKDLAGLVEYQANSVVSKMLLMKGTGNVTLFAFDKDQELSEHTAPYDALVQVLEGQALIRISGVEYPLKAGEAIVMPANQPHALKAVQRLKMLLTMIRA